MNGKRYFNEIKIEICLHHLFSKLHNYFSTKSPHTSIHFHQRCTSFWNPPLKNRCFVFEAISSLQTSPLHHSWSAGSSSVPLVLGTGGNHLEPDLGSTVDAAALKIPGVELHLLLQRGTYLAQTFRNPRTSIICPTLSWEIPIATAVSFCLMRRFPRISSSTRSWWSWSLAVTGRPFRVLSLRSALPSSPS